MTVINRFTFKASIPPITLVAAEENSCRGCYFLGKDCSEIPGCASADRLDKRSIIWVEENKDVGN